MKEQASFTVCGTVESVFVSPSGKFGRLKVSIPVKEGKRRKLEMRAFNDGVGKMRDLGQGETVRVTGDIEVNPLKDKAKNDVKVDGYACWVTELTLRDVSVVGEVRSAPAATKTHPAAQDADDSGIPF